MLCRTFQQPAVCALLTLTIALLACKKGDSETSSSDDKESSGEQAEENTGPLLTKPVDDISDEDLKAAIPKLGWTYGMSSTSKSGPNTIILVTGTQGEGDERRNLRLMVKKYDEGDVKEKVSWLEDNEAHELGQHALLVASVSKEPKSAGEEVLAKLRGKK